MATINIEKPLVSAEWLNQNLDVSNLVILDATTAKANDPSSETITVQIPNARYFDIKNQFSDVSNPFPNAVPSEAQFTGEVKKLGIDKENVIVVYDDYGIYSSARAWWLFKSFGHNNVAVLNGGLPEWVDANYPVEQKGTYQGKLGNFEATFKPNYFRNFKDVQSVINSKNDLIMDARSKERFVGKVPESRKGLRSGNIPNSVSLPYKELLKENKLKEKNDLISIFNKFDVSGKNMIFSCGSGVTACILTLAAENVGYKKISVYDGSWTEYGSLTKE